MATTYNIDESFGIYSLYNATSKSVMNGLTTEQKRTNARFIYAYLHTHYNWTMQAVAGFLANANAESGLNAANIESSSTNNAVANKWYPSYPGSGTSTDSPNSTDSWYGVGLTQVTPYRAAEGTKRYSPYLWGNMAADLGLTFTYNTGGTGLSIIYQLAWFADGNPSKDYNNPADSNKNERKWYDNVGTYTTDAVKGLGTVEAYAASTATAYRLANTMYLNYERPKKFSPTSRGNAGTTWYNYLASVTEWPSIPEKGDYTGSGGTVVDPDEPDDPGDITDKELFILPIRRRRRSGRTILF